MSPFAPESLRPRRANSIEVRPLPEGGAEITCSHTRRLRLSADALWLLERLDGRRDVRVLAGELSAHFGREVTPEVALDLLRRTLIANRLATFADTEAELPRARPLPRQRRVVLLGDRAVRAVARALAPLAAPWLAAPLLAGALVALGTAALRVAAAGAGAWREPWGWLLAVPLWLLGVCAHELGHALALARAGGRPGAIAVLTAGRRLRFAAELGELETLSPRARARVDVAGVAAQLVVVGAAAALALALGRVPPAPALGACTLLALGNLLPLPGTDGRWLLDDLAGRDPSDTIWRPLPPWRWLTRAFERVRLRAMLLVPRNKLAEANRLLPVFVSASFPDWPAARLRQLARAHLEMQAVTRRDFREIGRGELDEVRHLRPLRELRRAGRGAVVCGMHVGPYHYVPGALFELGFDVLAYASPNMQESYAAGWHEAARRRGGRLEVLSPRSTRDAVRALRALREGAVLFVLMDGQNATSRDQHRADFRFLGNDLYMRTGPALLAHHAGVPIVLAATHYAGVARAVVEFSDPLPPPEDESEPALVARTAELYAWFEPRVARVPWQWDGWVLPLPHWRATGTSPTTTRAELDRAVREAEDALAGRPHGARLVAEPTRVNWARSRDEYLIVHGSERRVLVADALACALLDAAFRRTLVRRLAARTGAGASALAPAIARLTLAGLATLER